jgi:hypothetical protein
MSVVFTETFAKDQRRFAEDAKLAADLLATVTEIGRDPFHNAALQTHAVKGAPSGVMTSYVGRQQHRVIWFKAGDHAVLLLFDRHDDAYRRVRRLKIDVDDVEGVTITEFAADADALAPTPARADTDAAPAPFDPWDDAILTAAGFAAHEINLLREVRDDDGVLDLQRYVSPEAFERAVQTATASSEAEVLALGQPDLPPTPEDETLAAHVETGVVEGRGHLVVVADEDLESILSRPIEDWMLFLHPDQQALVERRFGGPARVTGGAGTGKTVVGVHRAARLAAEGRRVLFTTYIRTLPPVLEKLFLRLSGEHADSVSFSGVHQHALSIAGRAKSVRIDGDQINAAFDEAWRITAPTGSQLRSLGLGKEYFRDEIAWVIKGRGLGPDDAEAYYDAPRTGRGTPFSRELREQIWALFVTYEKRLRARNTVDFDDVLRIARDEVRAKGDPGRFDAVIVDEAQDLTRVGLELVAAIGGDGDDGLLLLGDGQQSLYPGGHSLGAVGIDVRGRAAVLRLNYRNTREILAAANRVVAGRPFDDGDDELLTLDPSERLDVERSGDAPGILAFANAEDHDEALLLAVDDLADRDDTDLGDIAVLVPTAARARHYAARIADLGIPVKPLDRYDGSPSSDVKVGTFKRAKGLEFKHVLIPRVEPEAMRDGARGGEDPATHAERLDRTRRELYVAITRARDTVWVGYVGTPSVVLGLE